MISALKKGRNTIQQLNTLIPIASAPAHDTNSLLSGHSTTINYFTSQQGFIYDL